MMLTVKIQKVDNSLGVVLPKEVVSKLGVDNGDELFLIPTLNGFQVTPYDPEFDSQVSAAEEIMKKRRNLLRKFAE